LEELLVKKERSVRVVLGFCRRFGGALGEEGRMG
jgi:hypothetical protein